MLVAQLQPTDRASIKSDAEKCNWRVYLHNGVLIRFLTWLIIGSNKLFCRHIISVGPTYPSQWEVRLPIVRYPRMNFDGLDGALFLGGD